ncbi:hypothetical protein JST97_27655 [bacterium]|nr:hypothetical protein [bacterium]
MQCPSLDDLTPVHLNECERCRKLLALQEGLRAKLRQSEGEVPIPQGFQERLKARLDRVERAPERGRLASSGWIGRAFRSFGLAACLALALLPWLTRNQSSSFRLSEALAEHHSACWALPKNSRCASDWEAWSQAHQNPEVPVPLSASAGLQEQERRICPFGDVGKGPHLLLHDPKGRQASLFVLPLAESQDRLPKRPVAYRIGTDTVALWHGPHWGFALVSPASENETLEWIQPALGSDQPWLYLAAR